MRRVASHDVGHLCSRYAPRQIGAFLAESLVTGHWSTDLTGVTDSGDFFRNSEPSEPSETTQVELCILCMLCWVVGQFDPLGR
jgi:hypothetical protein